MRLFIIPFLVIEILDGHYRMAFALFILAGISDALDGLLARWLSQKTTLGQYLDPIADKLLLSTLFVVLTHVGMIPQYVTVLVFSRDAGILLISTLLFVTSTLRDFRPQPVWEAEYAGADSGFDRGALSEDICFCALGGVVRCADPRDCGAGATFGGSVCLDCVSEDECTANADSGLGLFSRRRGFRRGTLSLRWRCR